MTALSIILWLGIVLFCVICLVAAWLEDNEP